MKYFRIILKWLMILAIIVFCSLFSFRIGLGLRKDPWVKMVDAIANPVEKSETEIFGYKPEFYFDDPKILELCRAVDKREMRKMDLLLSGEILPFDKRGEKVDVNHQGKDGMTVLFWASQLHYVGAVLDTQRFGKESPRGGGRDESFRQSMHLFSKERMNCIERLLFFGADPNVQLMESQTSGMVFLGNGMSIVFFSAGVPFYHFDDGVRNEYNYFPLILEYGGNPNIVYTEYNATPIFAACNPSSLFGGNDGRSYKGRYISNGFGNELSPSPYNVGLLIDAGADMEHRDKWQNTPLIAAAGGVNFDIVLMLLEAGADYTVANEDGQNLAYFLYAAKHNYPKLDTEESIAPYYNKVIDFLKEKGYSLENAWEELDDKLKKLPPPQKNSTSSLQRPYDPFADEWISKRKEKEPGF